MALTRSRSGLTWLRSWLRKHAAVLDEVADVEEIELEDEDLENEDLDDDEDDDDEDDDEDDEDEW